MTTTAPFGTDWSTFVDGVPDLDPSFATLESPERGLAEVFARRLTTRRGTIPDDPDAGTDVRQWCQARMDPLKLAQMRQAVEAECLKDERADTVTARCTFDAAAKKTRIEVSGEGKQGKFALVLLADQLTVDLINTPG